jgi:hypothetical protein
VGTPVSGPALPAPPAPLHTGYRKRFDLAPVAPQTNCPSSAHPTHDKSFNDGARELAGYSPDVSVTYLTDLRLMARRDGRALPPRSVVLFVWQSLAAGHGPGSADILRAIAPIASAPIH